MKKNIMKKILSSLCALAMVAAPLSAFSADTLWAGNASLVIDGDSGTQLSCLIVNDFESPDFSEYTIASPYSAQIAILPGDTWEFKPNYMIHGTGPDTMFFNFTLHCWNNTDGIVAKKNMRAQRAMYGDMNCDGKIDANDVTALRRFISSSANTEDVNAYYYGKSLLRMMDLNLDSYINEKDVKILEDYIAGKNPGVPREFGSMIWVTLATDAVTALDLGNYGSTRLDIEKGDTSGDFIFNLYRN